MWKESKGFSPPTLFCSHRGRPWKHYTFSERLRKHAAEYKITPHQLRHMAGTVMVEGNLSADIIQAGLAYDERSSSEVYIDKTQNMRATALAAVSSALMDVQILSKSDTRNGIMGNIENNREAVRIDENNQVICPHCLHKFLIIKKDKAKNKQTKRVTKKHSNRQREWRNGRRARFRILWSNPWGFESPLPHHFFDYNNRLYRWL